MTAHSAQPTRRWIGGALLILSVPSFVETVRINDGWAGARLLPLVISVAFLALGLAHLRAVREPAPGPGDGVSDTAPERGAVRLVLASLVGYVALLSTAGFALATFGLLLILVHRLGGYGWRRSIGLAVGLALATHVVFVVWLGMPLPAGPLAR
jgi:hypothetical protein